MTDLKAEPGGQAETRAWFATTHWSVVLQARDGEGKDAANSLEKLCRIYWPPLYAFIRRQGYCPEAAQDLTQEFLARFFEKGYLNRLVHREGKFRSFLLKYLTHFLSDARDRAQAQKRGGGWSPVFLDALDEQARQAVEPVEDAPPAAAFDREWARTVLREAAERLRQRYGDTEDRRRQFEVLKDFQPGAATDPSLAECAARLGLGKQAASLVLHRFRQRYSEALREVIAETVERSEDVDGEIRYLIEILRAQDRA